MTKPKPPKTKKLTTPKLKEVYGRKAPDYKRRPKKAEAKTFEEELHEDVRQNLEWSIEARLLDKKKP